MAVQDTVGAGDTFMAALIQEVLAVPTASNRGIPDARAVARARGEADGESRDRGDGEAAAGKGRGVLQRRTTSRRPGVG
jgi:hypothetical protein